MNDSYADARNALERHLAEMPGNLPTAFENVRFTPEDGVAYQRCGMLWDSPIDGTMGRKLKKIGGIMQVTLMFPEGRGTDDASAQAAKIVDLFKPPMVIQEGGLRVCVVDPTKVANGFPSDGRWAVPVSVPWHAYVPG
jgi:hypothetical protein